MRADLGTVGFETLHLLSCGSIFCTGFMRKRGLKHCLGLMSFGVFGVGSSSAECTGSPDVKLSAAWKPTSRGRSL